MLRIIFRSLIASGKYTLLNIIGLVLGLTLTILIVMLLNYEITFDCFHKKTENILCVGQHDLKDGSYSTGSPYPLAQTLKNDFPEVKYVAGFNNMLGTEAEFTYNNLSYSGFSGAAVNSDVFSIFDFELILGKKDNVLDASDKIVISGNTAQKIFGSENPVGKVLDLEGFHFTISGIFSDLPENSNFNFDILFSEKINAVMWDRAPVAWWAGGLSTFVILNDNFSVAEFETHLKQIPNKYYPDFLRGRSTFFTIPFKGLHFDTSLRGYLISPVSSRYLLVLGLIAFLTLLVACVNFISLSTAQAKKRNMDAGIRRISGASSFQIIKQHLSRSSVTIFISLLIAIPLCLICAPVFESFVNREVLSQFANLTVWLGLAAICILLSLISGIIPGIIFAKAQPIYTLKNKSFKLKSTSSLRGSFVVFQFALIIVLIISQLFVFKQITDMKNADLGFDLNQLSSINVGSIDDDNYLRYDKVKVFKAELERQGIKYGFNNGSVTENIPGYYFQNSFTVLPDDALIDECLVVSTAVDENYANFFKIDLLHGRFFSEEYSTDRQAIVINETAMRKFGWTDIEGKFLRISHEKDKQPVIGVLKDITETSLKETTNPMIFRFGVHNNFPCYLSFRIEEDREDAALAFMNATWDNMFPENPFEHLDVKETYYSNYESEQELSKIICTFSGLAIFLTVLGLLGLIAFTSELRTKEIGIRKVNGAKIKEVMALLNRDFLRWVAIAFAIATPIAYFMMNKWLENFAYKTELSWWIFALAGLLALGIVLLTVSWQSWWAARRNPVEALRYE